MYVRSITRTYHSFARLFFHLSVCTTVDYLNEITRVKDRSHIIQTARAASQFSVRSVVKSDERSIFVELTRINVSIFVHTSIVIIDIQLGPASQQYSTAFQCLLGAEKKTS